MENMFICQSCGMPMTEEKDFGNNSDDSKNEDYCIYCYQKGQFTFNGNLEEMIEKQVSMHDMVGITEEGARKIAIETLPTLKRWKQ